MKYLLDTHIWIWWHMNPDKLSSNVKNTIQNSDQYETMLLSAISPWEFCKLLEKDRLAISCNPLMWINDALLMSKLQVIPLSPDISYKSTTLQGNFHNDPADQIIVATAIQENATLLTKDNRILNYPFIKSMD
jgi:PIN domain nuclease of toxin-antitoxin system